MEELNRNWQWMRVYYYDRNKDRLLLDAIEPTMRRMMRLYPACRWYFQREWHRGPNILIGTHAGVHEHAAAETIAGSISAYLEQYPSNQSILDSEYRRVNQRVERWEGKTTGSGLPCRPNNTIFGKEPEPEHLFLVDPLLKHTCWEFLASATPYILNWLSCVGKDRVRRDAIAMTLMIMIVWLADRDELRPYTSFCSHADGFIRATDVDTSIRTTFERAYAGLRGQKIRALIGETVSRLEDGAQEHFPGEKSFSELLAKTLRHVFEGIREKSMRPVEASAFFSNQAPSAENASMIKTMNECHEWRAWQITISLFYQTLNQLGISAAERFLACYLLGRGVEDVYGHDRDQLLHRINTNPASIFSFAR